MRYASLCDGIGAVHCAWQPLGWECAWTSEIEKFPTAVVEARHPGISNLGDMLAITESMLDEHERPDLVVAGTPCQSFSVAGLRGGLDDPRGNLALRFIQLVGVLQPTWVVWENVPGVLSSNRGRDFGTILGALAQLGYGFAYRVLDAQYFGVPQRRRRVFVVGCSRGWQRAAAVLSLAEGMRGDPPPSRPTRQVAAPDAGRGAEGASWWDGSQLSQTLDAVVAKGQTMPEKNRFPAVLEPVVTFDWQKGNDRTNSRPSTMNVAVDVSQTIGNTRVPAVAHTSYEVSPALRAQSQDPHRADAAAYVAQPVFTDVYNGAITGEVAATIGTPGSSVNASGPTVMETAGFSHSADGGSNGIAWTPEGSPPLRGGGGGNTMPAVMHRMAVRRLTPRECERLQGFPDHYTLIPWRKKPAEDCPDGPRYRALGNSMAVPVMRWIGERIAAVEAIR